MKHKKLISVLMTISLFASYPIPASALYNDNTHSKEYYDNLRDRERQKADQEAQKHYQERQRVIDEQGYELWTSADDTARENIKKKNGGRGSSSNKKSDDTTVSLIGGLISYFDARNQARKEKKISEANQEIQRATKYIQQYPNNWLVYLYRAAAYLNRGSITKNVNQYAKVITTDLQSAENLVNNAMRKNPDDLSVLVEHMYCYIFISLVYGRYNNTVQENRTINIADRDFLRIDKEYDLLQDFNEIKYKYNGADRRKLLDTYISIYEDRIYMYKFVNKIFYKRYSTSRYQQVEQKIKVLNKKLKELKKTSL